MPKKEEVSKLLGSMKAAAEPRAKAPEQSHRRSDVLGREMSVEHYQNNHAFPGAKYMLVGNSYNAEHKKGDTAYNRKRAAAIKGLFSGAEKSGAKNVHFYVRLTEALRNENFVATLSHFEHDWLHREGLGAYIGPAYDHKGKLLPGSFAVWRPSGVYHQTPIFNPVAAATAQGKVGKITATGKAGKGQKQLAHT